MTPLVRRALGLILVLFLGCSRGAKSPDEAYARFAAAVRAKNGISLFAALDLQTQWSWMSLRQMHREALEIILTRYPEGAREREANRYRQGAEAAGDAEFFAGSLDASIWDDIGKGMPIGGMPLVTMLNETEATATTPDGRKLLFRLGPKKSAGWGFAGLSEAAESQKRRIANNLETVRASAADFDRAAARGTP